ncbi:MAG: proline iminopeptidase [Acidobacteriota bacterium]|nr:proline iminopeptidase [Acidobacteriota bacterium]
MSVRRLAIISILLSLLAAGVACAQDELPGGPALRLRILKVSDLHEIYYEQSGNPQGKPIFFLHGGPGGSTSPAQRRYYDPKKFRIVLHDQRSAGRSRPFAEIRQVGPHRLLAHREPLHGEGLLPEGRTALARRREAQGHPTIIVNRQYDVICPPRTAHLLHRALPKSKLWIIEAAGHSGSEPGMMAGLVRAVRELEP